MTSLCQDDSMAEADPEVETGNVGLCSLPLLISVASSGDENMRLSVLWIGLDVIGEAAIRSPWVSSV